METGNQISAELQETAPILAGIQAVRPPYAVPAIYFEEFSEILMARIRLESAGVSGQNVNSRDEISNISPLLAELQKKNPYQVPDGFFQELQIKIRVSGEAEDNPVIAHPIEKPAPVRKISFPNRVIRYAVAACIAGLIVLTVFKISLRPVLDPMTGLANISVQDMANYLDADDIHWTPDNSTETAVMTFSDSDIDELLSNVPDAELEQYNAELRAHKRNVN